MKPESWLHIICAGIGLIIVIQIFLLTVTFDMKGRIGYFESWKDNIVDELKGYRMRFAQEEIISPFELALITTKPIEISTGNWVSGVHVIDAKRQERTSFEVPLDGPEDKELINLIAGIAFRLDEYTLSFDKLSDL